MPATSPSFFVDIYNMLYTPASGSVTPIPIFGVKSVSIDRQETVLKGMNNLSLRPVSSHVVGVNDIVTIDSEDINSLQLMLTANGQGTLAFNHRAAAHNVGSGALVDQTVTISNLVLEKKSLKQPSKGFGSYQISGFVMEAAGGDLVDPVAFTTATSPVSDAAN